MIDTMLCNGDCISVGQTDYCTSGTYIENLQTVNGCDSIVELNLTILDTLFNEIDTMLCAGNCISVGQTDYCTSGTYIENLQTVNGCDSIVELTLEILDTFYIEIDTTLCAGNCISVGQTDYCTSGTYIENLQTVNGCDSIVELTLVVLDTFYNVIDTMLCNGGCISVGQTDYCTSGTYIENLQTVNGCDSIVELDLIVLENIYTFISELSCNPSDTGLIETIFQGQQMCDSTVHVYTSLPYYAHLRNDAISTFRTDADGSIEDLILPGNERFSIDYFPNGDSIFLSGNRANNHGGGSRNDYSDSYLNLVNNNLSDIPALLLRNKSANTSKLSFDLSVGNPDYFDFIIWDIDEKDSCKIEVYDINNVLLSMNSFDVIQGRLFDHPNPPDDDVVTFLNDTIFVAAPSNDTVADRSYFILRFEELAISRIDITYFGENENCMLSEVNAQYCPNILFSLYVPNPGLLTAEIGSSLIADCDEATIILDGSGSTLGNNITYLWTGPNNFTSDELNPSVSEAGQYLLTLTLDDGFCQYTAMDSITVNFLDPQTIESTMLTCIPDEVGVFSDTIPDNFGCDSLILITTYDLVPVPLLINDTFEITLEDLPFNGDFSSNDVFAAGDILTIILSPTLGNVTFDGSGGFTLDGGSEIVGENSFAYEVCNDLCPNLCDTALVFIEVVGEELQDVLTPNGDMINDGFEIPDILNFPDSELMIFNRWGDIVFKRKNYQNDWVGQNEKGNNLPSGTYFYRLKYEPGGNSINGQITIIR